MPLGEKEIDEERGHGHGFLILLLLSCFRFLGISCCRMHRLSSSLKKKKLPLSGKLVIT